MKSKSRRAHIASLFADVRSDNSTDPLYFVHHGCIQLTSNKETPHGAKRFTGNLKPDISSIGTARSLTQGKAFLTARVNLVYGNPIPLCCLDICDRALPERRVFGIIRHRDEAGRKSRVDTEDHVRQFDHLEKPLIFWIGRLAKRGKR